ncbi:MAG: hypothetical protein LBM70_08965 [Victivallales bacterium]|jgi:DNA ligase (NAD+)|nr:hypothetical protein [Victivallales bacterium]
MDMQNFIAEELTLPELIKLIEYHNRRYWELGEPEISDIRYDELMRLLAKKDPKNELLTRVYAPAVAGEGKIRHKNPMLSLDKAYSLEEVLKWAQKYARNPDELFCVEPKYDGISASYDGRILSTRGDGESGENITAKIPLIEFESPGYTGKLDRPVRGELVIRDDDFKTLYSHIRKKGGGVYKNSRNAVAGIMGLKEIGEMVAQKAKITLVDYNLISYKVKLSELEKQWQVLLSELEALPYPQDGVVLKIADTQYEASLGNTAHHPRGQIAYKFTNIRRTTKLIGVEWSFGKSCLTPVANLEPVEISGTTIKRASLHNVQNIIDLGLEIGDTVTVERAGDVIPYIVASEPGENRRPALIEDCPCCKTKLVRRGPELCCPNAECFQTELQRLAAAVRNLGIEHLGEPTLRKLMENSGVKRLADLFDLTVMGILKLDGFAPKSAQNLINEIQKARQVKDYQLLAALNIPSVGANIAKVIFANTDFAGLRRMSIDELSAIPGIGPERAYALHSELSQQSDYLDELLGAVRVVHSSSEPGERPGVCFTGKMPEKRDYYAKLAEAHGFAAVDDVNSRLSLLVAADVNDKSTKLTKAAKLGIRVVSLEDFLREIATADAGEGTSLIPLESSDGQLELGL